MYRIGIDVGSTYTKYCVVGEFGGVLSLTLSAEKTPVRQREYFAEKMRSFREQYGNCPVVTCGYGRRNIGNEKTVTELTALAAGAGYQCPGINVILDIGGQDTKIILQDDGKLKRFFVNEKCAAGCGMFLENTLRLLQMDFKDIDVGLSGQPKIRLSSVCAVFAQSEIVEMIAAGVPEMHIIHAVLWQILTQAKALLGKMECSELALSGGLTRIPAIQGLAEQVLEKRVIVPEHAPYLSSIGCAVRGFFSRTEGL